LEGLNFKGLILSFLPSSFKGNFLKGSGVKIPSFFRLLPPFKLAPSFKEGPFLLLQLLPFLGEGIILIPFPFKFLGFLGQKLPLF